MRWACPAIILYHDLLNFSTEIDKLSSQCFAISADAAEKSIVLRKALLRCSLCRAQTEDLAAVERGYVCPGCVAKIK